MRFVEPLTSATSQARTAQEHTNQGNAMTTENLTRLADITTNAQAVRTHLADILREENGQVHFRPTAGGVTMVSLLDTSPQLGHGPYEAAHLARTFQVKFEHYCRKTPSRVTPEKRVQSFLIADAYRHERRMAALGAGELLFITDELALQQEGGAKVVCDILAFRPNPADVSRGVPVLIELKSSRQMTRLVAQLTAYAQEMITYAEAFARLYGAVLGRDIRFTGPPECWLVWPAVRGVLARDPRAADLAAQGIRVIQYIPREPPFRFAVSPV